MFWEEYSGTSGKKQELLSVFSKIALSMWRESLTDILSKFLSVSQQYSQSGL